MPGFRARRRVHHSAGQMFDLVADVERYPEFVPLCQKHTIRSRKKCGDSEILMTDMTVAYQIFCETHRSRVTLDRANGRILVEWPMVHCADSEPFGRFNRETTTAATWASTYPTSSQARCWRCSWAVSSTPHSAGSCKPSRAAQTPFMEAASSHHLARGSRVPMQKNCRCPLIPVASFTTQCTWNINELQVDLILFRRAEYQRSTNPESTCQSCRLSSAKIRQRVLRRAL